MLLKTLAMVIMTTAVVTCLPHEGWNELTNAKGIFDGAVNPIKSRSGGKHVILAELDDLLEQPNVLNALYGRYLKKFEKETRGHTGSAEVFKTSLMRVAAHNLEAKDGLHSWTRGINHFSHLSEKEYFAKYGMNPALVAEARKNRTAPSVPPTHDDEIPDSKDWRDTGLVAEPLYQGTCYSCTNFAIAAQLESLWPIFTGAPLVQLSPQYTQDCADTTMDHCDNGILPEMVYDFLIKSGDVPLSDYPYINQFQTCQVQGQTFDIKPKSYFKPWSGSEEDMKKAVAIYGPLYVSVNACRAFTDYQSGIFTGPCENTEFGTHSIVIIGYGTENGTDYWILKNSGGLNWGEKGYVRVARGVDQNNITAWPQVLTVK